jgi:spermidine/putrescine-binding protein
MSRHFLPFALSFLVFLNFGCESKKDLPELKIAIWSNYLSQETLKKFENQFNLKLKISHYASNDELLAKIQMNPNSFDLVVPSDYMVKILKDQNLLSEIDIQKIPNFKNIEPRFRGLKYDPENKFSIPYAWTTTGIASRTDLVKAPIDSLKTLFKSPELEGQISVLDDIRELTAAALKVFQFSANSKEPDQIDRAFNYLKNQKKQFKAFNSNAVDLLLNREIRAGLVYSSDALIAQKKDPKIEYRIPVEGCTWALDNWVILKNSPRKLESHQFIQFLTTAENNRDLVLNVRAGPVVSGTRQLLPLELQKNPALFPDAKTLKKLEMLEDIGKKQEIYEKNWTDFKTL